MQVGGKTEVRANRPSGTYTKIRGLSHGFHSIMDKYIFDAKKQQTALRFTSARIGVAAREATGSSNQETQERRRRYGPGIHIGYKRRSRRSEEYPDVQQ
jgi:hypothetical protein